MRSACNAFKRLKIVVKLTSLVETKKKRRFQGRVYCILWLWRSCAPLEERRDSKRREEISAPAQPMISSMNALWGSPAQQQLALRAVITMGNPGEQDPVTMPALQGQRHQENHRVEKRGRVLLERGYIELNPSFQVFHLYKYHTSSTNSVLRLSPFLTFVSR